MNIKKTIALLGSARSKGETFHSLCSVLESYPETPLINLSELSISPYDYAHQNKNDDFFPLIEKISVYDHIILASPVYWYTMSVPMKIFLDRLCDLLELRLDLKEALIGKSVSVIGSCNTSIPKGFDLPFQQTCEYMQMIYTGCDIFYWGADLTLKLQNEESVSRARARFQDIN